MTDLLSLLRDLRRPRLLIRAAQFGMAEYRRERDLGRIVRAAQAPGPERALGLLINEERRLETIRQEGCATYSFARHIEVLAAMLAEARLIPRRLA